jgi:uncharacterized iron-regulated membrane protein
VALSTAALRRWDGVHRWSSLFCTLFLLLLCLSGLPLIFHHEINHALGKDVWIPEQGGDRRVDLDQVLQSARSHFAGKKVLFISREPDDDRVWYVTLSGGGALVQAAVDARTASVLAEPVIGDSGVMGFLLSLHIRLFAGLPGELFLGFVGLVLVVSLVSGVVLYAPFMRHLSFGDIRRQRGPRVKWLDLHNLTSMSILVWLSVVTLTGVINTCATLVLNYWQTHQIAAVTSAYVGRPMIAQPAGLQRAVSAATRAEPDRSIGFIAFPGSSFSSPYHYGVFMRGATALTSRLVQPVFVDARSGVVTASPNPPWYVTALLLSEPLHFGDYGGLPLKILWAILDAIALVVIGSGLYLWVAR